MSKKLWKPLKFVYTIYGHREYRHKIKFDIVVKLQACFSCLITISENFLSCIFQGPGPRLGEMLCYQCMCNNRARATQARPGQVVFYKQRPQHLVPVSGFRGSTARGAQAVVPLAGLGSSAAPAVRGDRAPGTRRRRVVSPVGLNAFLFLNIWTIFVCGLNYSHGLSWAQFRCPQLYPRIKLVFLFLNNRKEQA